MGISLSGLTESSTGNLTISAGSGNDVLIGNGSTQIFIDGGTDTLGIGGTAVSGSRLNLETGAVALDFITSTGTALNVIADTVNDTSGAATLAIVPTVQIGVMTYTSTNAMTYTDTASLYIAGIPAASTNVTFTNAAYALWVDAGAVRFDDRTFWIGGIAYEFPADNGNANEMLLTDGSGNLSWSSVASASAATTVTVTDNEATNESNLITFVAGAATGTGNHGLEMDGDFHYSPNTGTLAATKLVATSLATASGALTLDAASNTFTLGNNEDAGLTFQFLANRTNASSGLVNIDGKWNNTLVARIAIQTGGDNTNKDDAHIVFQTASAGSVANALAIRNDKEIRAYGNLAFQQASTISTSSNNLTLSAATGADVLIGDNTTILQVDGGADSVIVTGDLDVNGAADVSGDLTLSAGADGALRFSAASSIKILDNSATALVIEEADNAYMTFVTTNSSEAITVAKATTFSAGIANAGTISAGTWNGTAIASAYLDSDTAHLSGTQTFTGAKTFAGNIDLSANDLLNVGEAGNDWTTNQLAHASAVAGGLKDIQIYNTATDNASSDARVAIVTTATGGNPYLLVAVSGGVSDLTIGIDNDQGDRAVISRGSGLGTNDAIRISDDSTPLVQFMGGISTDGGTAPASGALFGGPVLVGDGSVSAPSIANTGDANTGFFWGADEKIDIAIGGQLWYRFASGGMGIGEASILGSPGASRGLLELATDGGTYGSQLYLTSANRSVASGDALGGIEFVEADTNMGGSDDGKIAAAIRFVATETGTNSANGARLDFWTTPNQAVVPALGMTLDNSGSVGIGTSTPTEGKLVVQGDNSTVRVRDAGASSYIDMYSGTGGGNTPAIGWSDDTLRFYSGADRMVITTDGNVGIGDSAPTEAKLHVVNGVIGVNGFRLTNGGGMSTNTADWDAAYIEHSLSMGENTANTFQALNVVTKPNTSSGYDFTGAIGLRGIRYKLDWTGTSGGNITGASGLHLDAPTNSGGGTLSKYWAIYAAASTIATTNYGIVLEGSGIKNHLGGMTTLDMTSASVGGELRQEYAVADNAGGFGSIRKTFRQASLTHDTATTVFTINNTNESGNIDQGSYVCHIKAMVRHGGNNNAAGGGPVTRYWEGYFSKSVDYAGNLSVSSVTEAANGAQSALNDGQRNFQTPYVEVATANADSYTTAVQFTLTLGGTNATTGKVVVSAEVIWENFRTPPTIS